MTTNTIRQTSLATVADQSIRQYLSDLGEHEACNVYQIVIDEVERPLLDVIMQYSKGNQSRAARVLGLNRATLRTKLKRYDML